MRMTFGFRNLQGIDFRVELVPKSLTSYNRVTAQTKIIAEIKLENKQKTTIRKMSIQ